jgi:hypothetical protein
VYGKSTIDVNVATFFFSLLSSLRAFTSVILNLFLFPICRKNVKKKYYKNGLIAASLPVC